MPRTSDQESSSCPNCGSHSVYHDKLINRYTCYICGYKFLEEKTKKGGDYYETPS